MTENIKLLYIDLFCGAGGTSTGVETAMHQGEKCAKVIACVNHDAHAIASHEANHPDALHFTEDIRTLELTPLAEHLQKMRTKYPDAKTVLWASLECTNFSKAKGGQPRDADSRTLAEHLFRYIEALKTDYIQIENVEEFMCWGDLDENGKPISRRKGTSYLMWVKNVCAYGYDYDWRILNAADFGAYTSRKRFFGQFAREGLPIVFPKPTHGKRTDNPEGLFPDDKSLSPWKPVREVLDLNDEGESIFGKKKSLCENTLERIYAGLIKFVAGGKDAFLVKYNSMNRQGKYNAPGVDEPCPVVACQNRLGIARVQFLSLYYGGAEHNQSVEEPSGTVTTRDHHAFVTAYYGKGFNSDINEPAPTVTTSDRFGLVTSNFLDSQYGNGTPSSIEKPSPTVMGNPKQRLVTCKSWLMDTNFKNTGSSLEKPSPVVTASHKYHYLMNPQFASKGGSIENPCFTLIARMDKMPPYLISTEQGELGIAVFEDDSAMTQKIKEFMAMYGIIDIKMRMLNIGELKRIMGFPSDYTLIGTQAEQKKFIGNAVEVNMARVLCEALVERLQKQ
ncbi:MAG: DNA cytosine methyltransferase [Bacteroidaceae bacterium]|nr:DNA cytosine methyltransferase [Bacteroidaceae bacterium]